MVTGVDIEAAVRKVLIDLKDEGFFEIDFGEEYEGGPIQPDTDVPIPENHRQARYPWRQMEVGYSFFVPLKTLHNIRGPLYLARKSLGHQYVTRSWTQPDGQEGVRVWRVA